MARAFGLRLFARRYALPDYISVGYIASVGAVKDGSGGE
ncbi:unnamed protein product, partial [Ectocarpus sp. 4 AP-2014]